MQHEIETKPKPMRIDFLLLTIQLILALLDKESLRERERERHSFVRELFLYVVKCAQINAALPNHSLKKRKSVQFRINNKIMVKQSNLILYYFIVVLFSNCICENIF